MERNIEGSEHYEVRDTFEIGVQQYGRHVPGLVVVLDRRVNAELSALKEMVAVCRLSDDLTRFHSIDEAKDHLVATSLFFSRLSQKDIPVGTSLQLSENNKNSDVLSVSSAG
jgi:hypothetical protein